MLRIDVVTIFPRMLEGPLAEGIVRRACDRGLASIAVHDLREQTQDRHRSVDDKAFGGGPGMVMKVEPFARQLELLLPGLNGGLGAQSRSRESPQGPSAGIHSRREPPDGPSPNAAVVLLSPRGQRFDQRLAEQLAGQARLVLLCGRYEGVDERVREALCTHEVSLGDFVLTGGEVAALAVIEATVRLLPGALGDEESAACDSFADGLLDHPHYTRPSEFRGLRVPEVLLSGDHGRVRRWRRKEALRATRERRPDLIERARLSKEDRDLLREIEAEPAQLLGAC